eukprot:TRINITY_DN1730_c0_g1_i1.p2 TRINITY_DN1730_c0_g1~~TRINITY_DN1730_c0_g1_i1.p2  ORF type:complete len:264 (+),score=87.01 TRINITY_DN1730_c0_g1_i1:93-884(+)
MSGNDKRGGMASERLSILPSEFYYSLTESEVPERMPGRTWEGTPVAILAVSNPSDQGLNVKVRVNHLEFLVRPPRFHLPAGCKYFPLLIRLSPNFPQMRMQLCEDRDKDAATTGDEASARLLVKKVGPNDLPASMAVSRGRRGNIPIFHAKELTTDQVREALDRTGIHSVAADFIKRGISFKKLCALVWGCCLQVRPTAPHGFLHEAGCPLVTMRDKVKLTKEGMNCKQCPLCGAERTMIQQGEGGITFDLINIVIQYIDPLY